MIWFPPRLAAFLTALSLVLCEGPALGSTALDYLNTLRASAGMVALSRNAALETAAANHADYLALNQVTGHYENSADPGFTGATPAERAAYAGYLSTQVLENVALDGGDAYKAIDSLMSAIYHRFGFLDLGIDEIGIGINSPHFTFDMGNSLLNALCGGTSFSGSGSYVWGVCADSSFKISSTDFDAARQQTGLSNPAIVLWPPRSGRDIPPVFFEESPDPLPGHSVTGYPVSVQFNEWKTAAPVSVSAFSLFDDTTGSEVSYARRVLQPSDDVNGRFSAYQFAIFPLQRLEWGRTYRASVTYAVGDGTAQTLSWRFTTRGLPHRYYRIENQITADLEVVSGKAYSIYFVPQDSNDRLGGYSMSYQYGMTVDATFLDQNTIDVTVTGSVGQTAMFTMANGLQLNLTIANSDNALDNTVPPDTDGDGLNDDVDNCPNDANSDQQDYDGDGTGDTCDSDDDNDGLSDTDETTLYGTNPLQADTDGDGMDDRYEVQNDLDPNRDDAAEDKDGDGLTNLQEAQLGSAANDPNDPAGRERTRKILQAILPLLLP